MSTRRQRERRAAKVEYMKNLRDSANKRDREEKIEKAKSKPKETPKKTTAKKNTKKTGKK